MPKQETYKREPSFIKNNLNKQNYINSNQRSTSISHYKESSVYNRNKNMANRSIGRI